MADETISPPRAQRKEYGCYTGLLTAGSTLREDTSKKLEEIPLTLAQLRASEATIDHFNKIADEQDSACKKSKTQGDYSAADVYLTTQCEVLQELFTLHLERVSILEDPNKRDDRILKAARATHTDFERELHHLKENTEDTKEKVRKDLGTVYEAKERVRSEGEKVQKELKEASRAAAEELKENTEKRMEVYEQIMKLIAELTSLGEHRMELVNNITHNEKAYNASVAKQKGSEQVLNTHEALLREIDERADAMMTLTAELEDSATARLKGFEGTVEAGQRKIESVLLSERKAHYKTYAAVYKCLGERLFTAERRAEELQSAADAAEWRTKMSGNTLDHAGLEGCRENAREIKTLLETQRDEAEKFRKRLDQVTFDAAPTETALIEAKVDIKSPPEHVRVDLSKRVTDVVTQRKSNLDKTAQQHVLQEESAAMLADPGSPLSKAAVKKPAEITQQERQAASERRRRDYAARVAGGSDAWSPGGSSSPQVERYVGGSSSPLRVSRGDPGLPLPKQVLMVAPPEPSRAVSRPAATTATATPPPREIDVPSNYTVSTVSPPRDLNSPPMSSPTQPSPFALSSPGISLANCEELRKRAEQLRKAALESRRRAQAHREQADAVSPRSSGSPY
eukprot:TRINITY_DN15894_c0_g1_i1.p2 TRINITY_DN15894_c0_g1~~TRINITY_DN15894_c0_g1_i1.p2  ORF type:complete len:663 (+),score=153.27 TRINITY_DN15894_c0_g1_i1:110-1990(+)